MTDINSELDRLRAAPPLEQAEVFERICATFSSRTVAKAIAAIGAAKPRARSTVKKAADHHANDLSDR